MIGLTRHTHLIKAVLAGTVLLLYLCGFCQSVTFNTHHHLGLKYIQPGGILPINTGYLYVGLAIDTMEYRNNWIIGKFDPAGNPVCYNIYRHSLHHQKLTWSDILPYNDSTFITIGSDSLLNGFVVLFNENCDTIATKAIRLNYQGSTLEEIRITDFLRTSDDGYVAIGNASFADTRQQGVILKIGKTLELEWYDFYIPGDLYTGFEDVSTKSNGNILVFGFINNTGVCVPDINFTSQLLLREYTLSGAVVQTRHSELEYIRNIDFAVTPLQDGSGFIASAGTIKKEPCGFPDTYLGVSYNSIQKYNNQLRLIWDTQIGNLWPSPDVSYKEQVIAHDGSGIIAAGNAVSKYIDSSSYHIAVMSKVNWAGDSIWTRFIVADSSYGVDQYVFDIEATDDGGYILCGLANFHNDSTLLLKQHLWSVKTDEYGCVVPNCQLKSSLSMEGDLKYRIDLFPNPASTKLNIYIGKLNPHRRIKMSIVSGSGQVFHSSDVVISDATYVIDIHQWPEGFYYLQIHENTLSRTSVGFVVVR